jgi:excisionase family DNA binding protein
MQTMAETTQPVLSQLVVDVSVASKMLGVCSKTLRREINRGELASVRIGKAVRIRVVELHAYLKRKERKVHI